SELTSIRPQPTGFRCRAPAGRQGRSVVDSLRESTPRLAQPVEGQVAARLASPAGVSTRGASRPLYERIAFMSRLLLPLTILLTFSPALAAADDADPQLTLKGHEGWVGALAFAPRGTALASGSSDRTIRIWTPAGKQSSKLEGHHDCVCALAWGSE